MTKTIRPFDAGGWFPIHNAVFDVIMPQLSPNGWKILCVAIRQTWGWVADGSDTRQRKQADRISYSQFKEKAGIGSYSTVSRALEECLEAGYLNRRQVDTHPGTGKPIYAYELNTEYEMVVKGPTTETVAEENATTETVVDEPPTTETVVGPTTETVAGATTETVDTKQRETKETNVVVGTTKEQKQTEALLTSFGVTPVMARRLAKQRSLRAVEDWITYAKKAKGLHDPVAFVVARLRDGESPPDEPDEDTYRTVAESWIAATSQG